MSTLLAVKRNQLAISKLQVIINNKIAELDQCMQIIKHANTHNKKAVKSAAFSRKNRTFKYLCQLQDALTLERKLTAHYQREQNKNSYSDKFAVTHGVISDVIKTNDKKMWEQKNKILLQNAMIADIFQNNHLVNWSA